MLDTTPKYTFNDINIVPAYSSIMCSRYSNEMTPFLHGNDITFEDKLPYCDFQYDFLPLFTSQMDSVVSIRNIDKFKKAKIHPIVPRTESFITRTEMLFEKRGNKTFIAFSLREFMELFGVTGDDEQFIYSVNPNEFISRLDKNDIYYISIDIANGHMRKLYSVIKTVKMFAYTIGVKLVIMTGNIANPDTYILASKSGVEFLRCSIGTGGGCLTTSQTGIGYPIASLIAECAKQKMKLKYCGLPNVVYKVDEKCIESDCDCCGDEHESLSVTGYGECNEPIYEKSPIETIPLIVADGGVRCYADAIKALALGADMVMIGSEFTKCLDSASDILLKEYDKFESSTYEYKEVDTTKKAQYEYTQEDFDKLRNSSPAINDGIYKRYWGMASLHGQHSLGKEGVLLTHPEGTEKILKSNNLTIAEWSDKFETYLRSAMSYTNARTLTEFTENTKCVVTTQSAHIAINKPEN